MQKKSWFYFSYLGMIALFTIMLVAVIWIATTKPYSGQTKLDAGDIEQIRKQNKVSNLPNINNCGF